MCIRDSCQISRSGEDTGYINHTSGRYSTPASFSSGTCDACVFHCKWVVTISAFQALSLIHILIIAQAAAVQVGSANCTEQIIHHHYFRVMKSTVIHIDSSSSFHQFVQLDVYKRQLFGSRAEPGKEKWKCQCERHTHEGGWYLSEGSGVCGTGHFCECVKSVRNPQIRFERF